jgi:hypothetical protein
MGDYNRVGFEKAFKKAVPNFDETKIHFEHKSRMMDPSKVCFVWQGKLWKCEMYKSQCEIDTWAKYINFLFVKSMEMIVMNTQRNLLKYTVVLKDLR